MIDSEAENRRREALFARFEERYGGGGRLFSSPGRAEIVGNHTDHNGGRVLVSAISCDILCVAAPRGDGVIEISSEENFAPIRFSVHDLASREREKGKSLALARGVVAALVRRGYSCGGFSAVTQSTVFRGAGVSSSAAFEVLIAEIENRLYSEGRIPPIEKARAAHYAENVYFGKPCGLLDQAGVAFGGFNLVDFSGEPAVRPVPRPKGYSLVVVNTGGSHAGLTAHYADIRREMGEVAAYFGKSRLIELPFEEFFASVPRLRGKVSDRAILRAFHFYEENGRVDRAAEALFRGDMPAFLSEVNGSGRSSLGYLQNACVPGETVQPLALAMKLGERLLGREGAVRLQGGGFAGAVIAFCPEGGERAFGREMGKTFGRENIFYADLRSAGACGIEGDEL